MAALVLVLATPLFPANLSPDTTDDEEAAGDVRAGDSQIDDALAGVEKINAPTPTPPTPAEQKKKEEELANRDKQVEKRLKEKPNSPQTAASAGNYFQARGQTDKAIEQAERGLKLARPGGDPKLTARLLLSRGLARYLKRDYESAHADAKLALEKDPKNWAAYELYMYSLDKWPKGKRSPAIAAAGKAEGLKAKEEGAQDAKLRPNSGMTARTDTVLLAGGGVAPTTEDAAVDRERAQRLLALQTPGLARTPEEWQARQDAAPSAAYELLMQSMRARKAGDFIAARNLAEVAARADPADPMVYANRALILSQMGDAPGAVADLSRVIARGWKWGLAFRMRADALFKAKKWRAAMTDAELAAKLDPADADAWFILGMARSMLGGDSAQALAELDRAAALKPALAGFRDMARERLKGRP